MTLFLLIRHAAHDNVGAFLAGRMTGISLGAAGRAQAGRLAARLASEPVAAIYTSPRERTCETAAAIASATSAGQPSLSPDLDEIDFGVWSGRSFDDLNGDLAFRRWNAVRSQCRTPGGESMLDVQQRVTRLMERLDASAPVGAVLLVSHADVIKAALMHHLGLPIDAWEKLEISPASISTIETTGWGSKVLGINEVVW